jgi:molybdopterin-guanine dinucleotide biosynthesis protein A
MPGEKIITVIILAGGKSSRMKEEKGLVIFREKMLIEYVIESVKKITGKIIIITANPAYRQFGYPCFEDELKEKGPLGGIYTGLLHSTTQKNLVVGCDMPFLSEKLLNSLINHCGKEDVLLSEHRGLPEPLCSVYDKSCTAHFLPLLNLNKLKITNAFKNLKIRVISFDMEDWFSGIEFMNINSIDDMGTDKK